MTFTIEIVRSNDLYKINMLLTIGPIQAFISFYILKVDLMKRNPDIGASCGRIHPTGSGYMQWYQV